MEVGLAVRIKQGDFLAKRPHLQRHSVKQDTGVVIESSPQNPIMAQLYIIVKFESCGLTHRLNREEIEVVSH